jgi:hypothetical protein
VVGADRQRDVAERARRAAVYGLEAQTAPDVGCSLGESGQLIEVRGGR